MTRNKLFGGTLAGLAASAIAVSGAQLSAQNTESELPRDRNGSAAQADTNMHTGRFIRIRGADFLMSTDGTEHAHRISDTVRVTVNGKEAALGDLREGMVIRVTVNADNELQSVQAGSQTRNAPETATDAANASDPLDREQQQLSQFPRSEEAARVPQLGVRLRPSPTQGVFVEEIRRGSAAEQAGLERGDYILTIAGQQISDPDDLRQALTGVGFGSEAEIVVWRDGQRQTLSTSFMEEHQAGFRPGDVDSRNETSSANDQAWLGVMLADPENEERMGARVVRTYPSGPAARADLRNGDIIEQVDGQTVKSADELSEAIRNFKAGETVTFAVRDAASDANTQTELRTVQVRLARRGDFFDSSPYPPETGQVNESDFDFRQHVPEHAMMLEQHRHLATQHQRIEQVLYELRDEVQQLRQEIRQLRGEKAQLDESEEQ